MFQVHKIKVHSEEFFIVQVYNLCQVNLFNSGLWKWRSTLLVQTKVYLAQHSLQDSQPPSGIRWSIRNWPVVHWWTIVYLLPISLSGNVRTQKNTTEANPVPGKWDTAVNLVLFPKDPPESLCQSYCLAIGFHGDCHDLRIVF